MAVTLPGVLLILDWYPLGRVVSLRSFLSAFLWKIPFIALSLVSSILTILAQSSEEAMRLMEAVPLSTRLLVAAKALSSYLRKMLLPLDLIPYYPYPKDVSFLSYVYLLPVLFVIGTTILCFVIAYRQKLWLAVWGYYILTLVPVVGIVQVGGQAMADRYTYLPGLGPFLLIGLAVAWISAKRPASKIRDKILNSALAATSVFVFIGMTFLTVNQIGIWKNTITLWTSVIEKEPETVPLAYQSRGTAFFQAGQLDKAIADYDKSIALYAFNPDVFSNRGAAFSELGQPEKAIADYSKAIDLILNGAESFSQAGQFFANRGLAYRQINQRELALNDFKKACDLGNNFGCQLRKYEEVITGP